MFQRQDASYMKGALTGVIAGAAIGAGLALLLAPHSGAETREGLRRLGRDARQKAGGLGSRLRRRGTELVEQVHESAERARDVALEAIDAGTRVVTRAGDHLDAAAATPGAEAAAGQRSARGRA